MQNYARYRTYFTYFLGNIEATHHGATEELLNGSISVSRSFVPSSRCQLDKTIEETIMKHAKSHNQASGGKGDGLFGVENFLTYCLIISLQN